MAQEAKMDVNTILFSLVAAQAVYYFLSGGYLTNTATWDVLVVIQFFAALGAIWWNRKRQRNLKEA